MSHFFIGVFVPANLREDQVEAKIEALMEPYSENLEVEMHEEPCWCLTLEADSKLSPPPVVCEQCNGTGKYETTSNPNSHWDWYVIGGRWDGEIQGKRRDDGQGGFNFDDEHHQVEYNSMQVKDLLKDLPTEVLDTLTGERGLFCPRALVTPDGEWHEKTDSEFFGKSSDHWEKEVFELLQKYREYNIIGVDCHV